VFVVLDANHFSELVYDSARSAKLQQSFLTKQAQVFTTIITSQESAEGWFALIKRAPEVRSQVPAYTQYQHSLLLLQKLGMLPFDDESATRFEALQNLRLRIGTMDLKIASICLAHDATLLTRNLVDFRRVPGLRVENWLD
jgi:tRNA(fMet)-specific endonuclease VapC